VPPAQLRLDAGDPLLLQRDDRLEEQEELVPGGGALQVGTEQVTTARGVAQCVVVATG
jgi:hypothetical protein